MKQTLTMWTVYKRPRDYPESYVARRCEVSNRHVQYTSDMFVADSLNEIRMLLPPGLHCIGRDPKDDPVIVEVWL